MGKGKNNFWLDDDPEWEALRRRVNKKTKPAKSPPAQSQPVQPLAQPQPIRRAPQQQTSSRYRVPSQDPTHATSVSSRPTPTPPPPQPKKSDKVEVSLKVSLPKPKLKKPQVTLPKLTKKQRRIGLVASAALCSILVVGVVVSQVKKPSSTDSTGVLADTVTQPTFDTVLPEGKSDQVKDSTIKYDPEKRVASFKDTIGTADITVSQQELPDNFKGNPDDEIKKLAENFSAVNVVNESNPKAYIGTDENTGAQTVIFHKNGLLVFILSNKQIDKDQWAEYITKLI